MNCRHYWRFHQARKRERNEISLIVNEVKFRRVLKNIDGVKDLPNFGVDGWDGWDGSSEYGAGQTHASPPAVWLSNVANGVISTPRALNASVNRLVTSSHGP